MNYCPYCGISIAPDYMACPHCGKTLGESRPEPSEAPSERKPESFLVHAGVLAGVSFFFCWFGLPFALISLYYGDQVDRLWRGGDPVGAQMFSVKAHRWFKRGLWAIAIFYVFILLALLICIVGVMWLGWFAFKDVQSISYI